MTRIDFYVLAENARSNRFQVACKLVDKAYQAGHRICVHLADEEQLKTMDELLWTFDEQSFIPHEIMHDANHLAPVILSTNIEDTNEHDVLINLTDNVPASFSQFDRLLEPVDPNQQSRIASRERYRYYRDCGYTISNHEISI